MLLLALTVLVVGASGQASQQTPQPCCVNHEFTALMGQISGTVSNGMLEPIDGYQELTYDFDAKLIAARNHLLDATTGAYIDNEVLDDFNTMKQYIFNADGTCVYTPLNAPMTSPCVPDNSTFLGAVTFGSGQSTLKGNVWEFTLPGTQATARLVVSADNCTPIIQGLTGRVAGEESMSTLIFMNFEPTIANRTVLTLPAAGRCRPMPTPNPQNPAVGRRSVFFS